MRIASSSTSDAEMRGFRDQNNRVLSAMREDLTDLRADMDEGFRKMHEGLPC